MKKNLIGALVVIASISLLTACGGKTQNDSEGTQQEVGEKISPKDVASKKDKVVDGKEVTEYTMKDGSKMDLPRDVDLNDVRMEKIEGSDLEGLEGTEGTITSEEE